MSDLWDFSSLLRSFRTKSISDDLNTKYENLSETMTNQLDKIHKQLSLLENESFNDLSELDLLYNPGQFPISPPTQSPINTKRIEEMNKSMNLSFQQPPQNHDQEQQKDGELYRVITPPTGEKYAPRQYTRTKSRSISNSNSNLNSSKTKTKVFSTKALLPPLKKNTSTTSVKDKAIFKATPDEIRISNFILSKEYKFHFTLQNVSSNTHGFLIKGPTDPAFSFRIVEKINTSLIRPGLHITFEITFTPTEPRDYASSLVIISGDDLANTNEDSSFSDYNNNNNNNNNSSTFNDNRRTVVRINCNRDPPNLEIPDVINLNSTLVHSSKTGSFTITNHGGIAFFSFKSLSGREDSLTFKDGSFTLAPSQFQLAKEESIEITIKFKPRSVGKQSASFEIIPQYFPQRFYFIAQGNSVAPNLKFTMCQDNKFLFVPFLPSDINTPRQIQIFNDADLSFPFHLQILKSASSSKSILKQLYSDIDLKTDNHNKSTVNDEEKSVIATLSDHVSNLPFNVTPSSGQISPKGTVEITISFSPKFYGFFRANLAVFVDKIPDITGALGSKRMMTMCLEAYSGTPDILIQPQLVIFHSVIPNVSTQEMLEISNNSYLKVNLNWPQNQIVKPINTKSNSLSSTILPQEKKTIELNCLLSKSLQLLFYPTAWKLFQRNPKIVKTLMLELRKALNPTPEADQNNYNRNNSSNDIQSPSCAVSFKPNEDDFFQTAAEVYNEENTIAKYSTNNSFQNSLETNKIDVDAIENDYEEENINDDEIPNIFALRSVNNSTRKTNNLVFQQEKLMDEISLDVQDNQDISMKFSYLTHISKPELIIEPPTLDFGFILAGETGKQTLDLKNPSGCPIRYQIDIHPLIESEPIINDTESESDNNDEIIIDKSNGIINSNDNLSININLNVKKITKVIRYITIKSWWSVSPDNENDISMPSFEFDVKILACIDRPLLGFQNRVIDIGNVYPTLQYNATFEGKLLNSFPTPFWVDDYTTTAVFKRNINIDNVVNRNKNLLNDQIILENLYNRPKSVSNTNNDFTSSIQEEDKYISETKNIQNERSSTVIGQHNENQQDLENINIFENKIEIQQSTTTQPKEGNLEIGSNIKLDVSANFAELGDHAFPITVNVKGNKYTCAIVAHVLPPKITLLTEKVDFSDDFIICRRSESRIIIKNECGIASSVRLEVNDDCHNVFQLHDITTHQISPDETVEFPISCYSEVHGDFYGSFKLIIRDLWQFKEIIIPLHVKAHRSFFGFQTHTLGYTKWDSEVCTNDEIYSIINSYKYGKITGIEELDFVYFGVCSSKLTNALTLNSIKSKGEKILRRLYIENYSSEPIFIDWSLLNFVPGRKYANVSLEIEDDGYVKLDIQENNEDIIEPFKILSERTKVNPHDRSLVEVEFDIQNNPGTYRGILAAKCGEFTHELGLVAICV